MILPAGLDHARLGLSSMSRPSQQHATVLRGLATWLLGVGVAFKIYYVTAWRRGESNFLESVLTRAVFYSTLLTATAFGSLWVSNQPGISSMGKLLAQSLVCTLTSAALFQPALMGEPRRQDSAESKRSPTTNNYSQR
jgi:predicted exporter